jgi:hypothetical protein
VVVVSEKCALAILNLSPATRRGNGGAIDRDRLIGVTRLAARLVAGLASDHYAVVVHGDLARVEVHGIPLQTADLAAANASGELQ